MKRLSFLRLLAGCALALLASFAVARADSYGYTKPFSETHPFAADGEVVLANVNGAVTIRTWDRPEIRVEGEKRAKTQEELDLIELTIKATSAKLDVKTVLPQRPNVGWFGDRSLRGAVNLTLTVPATARLRDIGATNGSITISDVRSAVNARLVNGKIVASGLGADTSLETVNGSIRAEFATLAPGQKISVRTVNGSTTVTLPREASLTLSARTVNGSVDCEFPLTIKGTIKRNRVSGTIGSGAASLESETVNGSLRVKSL